MIIVNARVTTRAGNTFEFNGVQAPVTIAGGALQFESALGNTLGCVFAEPGLVVEYSHPVAVTSQVNAEMGMVPKRSEDDDMNK